MFWIATFALAIPSPLIVVISSEAWAVFIGLTGTRHWLPLAAALALGQCVLYSLLYIFGRRLLPRFPRLQRKLDQIDIERFRRQSAIWVALGAVFGLPPLTALSVAAPMVRMRFAHFYFVALAGRFVRFSILAAAAGAFGDLFELDVTQLPEWVQKMI